MNRQIVSRWDNTKILYQVEAESFAALVSAAIKASADLHGADLRCANLQCADLHGADLQCANLQGADLHGADLHGADLQCANLQGADLHGADLHGADLQCANLQGADLHGADLHGANLHGANLHGANLHGADLQGADLHGANLHGANLPGADLSSAKNISQKANAESSIVPESGAFEGWKKCSNAVIVRVQIPEKAKRSNATGRKCRAEFVKVLEVIGAPVGISQYDQKTEYRKGKTVQCDKWEADRWIECAGGIHFFLTRYEAENY